MKDLNKKFGLSEETVADSKVPMKIDDPDTSDFHYVRRNIYDLTEKSAEALEELMAIARASQNPRAYEVLGIFMERMSNFNKDLYNLHKQRKDLTSDTTPQSVENHNHLHITTEELNRMLTERKKD